MSSSTVGGEAVHRESLLERTINSLSAILACKGFEFTEDLDVEIGMRMFIWKRRISWKSDEVILVVSRGADEGLKISYNIYLMSEDLLHPLLDGVSVNYLVGRTSLYRIPVFRVRSKEYHVVRVTDMIIDDVSNTMYWFDERDTPAKCLELIRAGHTNTLNRNEVLRGLESLTRQRLD